MALLKDVRNYLKTIRNKMYRVLYLQTKLNIFLTKRSIG